MRRTGYNGRMHILQDIKLMMDGRILNRPGSGIATYAAQLRQAQKLLQPDAGLIIDDHCVAHPTPDTPVAVAKRWWAAQFHNDRPWFGPTQEQPSTHYAPDIYRLAAARFRRKSVMTTLASAKPKAAGVRHLVHWSLPLPVRVADWINVYTIHDVIPITHPDLTPMNREHHIRLLDLMIRNADHIVTVSDHARNEIIRVTGCMPDMITNCGTAVQMEKTNIDPLYDLVKKKYLLYIGSGDKRKNIDRIVAAYVASKVDIPLVLVGPHIKYIDESAHIFCVQMQSKSEIDNLISNALALIFPSLAEGFGLPVVEAMAAGTAVLTSKRDALAEVAGQAALLVDPTDVAAIAEGIIRLTSDVSLRRHYELAGPIRASDFSMGHFAKRISALYATLASHQKEKAR